MLLCFPSTTNNVKWFLLYYKCKYRLIYFVVGTCASVVSASGCVGGGNEVIVVVAVASV